MLIKKFLFTAIFSFIAINIVYSQPAQYWLQYHYGGEYDYSRDLAKDTHGNYIVTGSSVISNPGYTNYGVRTVKYDSLGNLEWMKVKDFTNSMDDPFQILLDDSDNVYIFGILEIGYNIGTFFLMKYDEMGNEKWFKTFSSLSNFYVLTDRACIDGNGNIYCAGATEINNRLVSFIRKYSYDGSLIWYKELDGISTLGDYPNCIIPDLDGNIYLAGEAIISDSTIYHYVTKLNYNGDSYWQSFVGTDTIADNRKPVKLLMAENSNLYLLGMSNTNHKGYDFNIIKIDSTGNKIWENFIYGYQGYDDYAKDIVIDDNHDVYVTGSVAKFYPPNMVSNIFTTVKYNENGDLLWSRVLGQLGNYPGIGLVLEVDENNDLYVAGGLSNEPFLTGSYDMMLLKYNTSGDSIWAIRRDIYNIDTTPADMILNAKDDLTIILTGVQSYVTIRYSNNPPVSIEDDFPLYQFQILQNYPNPFNSNTIIRYFIPEASNVKIELYDVLGDKIQLLVNEFKSAGNHSVEFNGSELSSGIYFYRFSAGIFNQTKKMLLLK